MIMSTLVRKRY